MPPKIEYQKLSDYLYEIPKSFRSDMRVPRRAFIRNRNC